MKLRVLPAVLAATAIATAAVMPSMVGATDTAAPAGPVGTGITGEYVGTIGLNGGFSPRLAEIAAEAGATGIGDAYMNFLYDLIGPLTITMDDGAMDGSWSMAGTGIIEGELSGGGMEIRIYGDGVYDGAGTLTGTPGELPVRCHLRLDGDGHLRQPVHRAGVEHRLGHRHVFDGAHQRGHLL